MPMHRRKGIGVALELLQFLLKVSGSMNGVVQSTERSCDAVAAVMAQDSCLSPDGLDRERWLETIFLPVTLVCDGKTFAIETRNDYIRHLDALERKARELGVVQLRTHVTSSRAIGQDVYLVQTVRERLTDKGEVVGQTPITCVVIRADGEWRINQILFDDARIDPSVVAMTFLGHSMPSAPAG